MLGTILCTAAYDPPIMLWHIASEIMMNAIHKPPKQPPAVNPTNVSYPYRQLKLTDIPSGRKNELGPTLDRSTDRHPCCSNLDRNIIQAELSKLP